MYSFFVYQLYLKKAGKKEKKNECSNELDAFTLL